MGTCKGEYMLNVCFIAGNLGADPTLRAMPNGQNVCGLRVATSEKWTDKSGEKQEVTSWHSIDVFGRQAETCAQYLSKGRQVLIEGSIRYRKVEDAQGGTKYFTSIKAKNVQFLGEKQQEREIPIPPTHNDTAPLNQVEAMEQDIPF